MTLVSPDHRPEADPPHPARHRATGPLGHPPERQSQRPPGQRRRRLRRRRRLGPWGEVLLVIVLYGGYSFVRGQFGSASVTADRALDNANTVIALEQRLGIFNELTLQQWFLHWPVLVRFANVFYGIFHFAVPIVVLVLLYRRAPSDYGRWRNCLVATTVAALAGFSLFPLMPPRLLCACPLGSGTPSGFVDTLDQYGGLWTFTSHGVGAVTNQYAAMPSLHFAWALWCGFALFPHVRHPISRALVAFYPLVTLIVIIVTANHFWLDAVGGAVVFAAGVAVTALVERCTDRWTDRWTDRGVAGHAGAAVVE
jgi:PAP2 superfamily